MQRYSAVTILPRRSRAFMASAKLIVLGSVSSIAVPPCPVPCSKGVRLLAQDVAKRPGGPCQRSGPFVARSGSVQKRALYSGRAHCVTLRAESAACGLVGRVAHRRERTCPRDTNRTRRRRATSS